jgi:adenylate kinase
MASYIVLLGPPGVGKGTQAKIIAQKTGKPHVSSGDLFRENIKNGTDLGKLAQSFIQKGELVPDDVTIAMIRDRFTTGSDCQDGVILDGFPRTPAQAIALDKLLEEFGDNVDIVPYITAPEEILVARLSGRWTCPQCGHIFNTTFNPPKQSGICDFDGSRLYQRDDDKAETVTRRIQVYLEQTAPLISYYREAGKLAEVNGALSIEDVTTALLDALDKVESK